MPRPAPPVEPPDPRAKRKAAPELGNDPPPKRRPPDGDVKLRTPPTKPSGVNKTWETRVPTTNAVQVGDFLPLVYGKQRVVGRLLYGSGYGDTLNGPTLVYAACAGPIQSFDKVFIDTYQMTSGVGVTWGTHLGAYNQATYSGLTSAGYATRLPGVAYIHISIPPPTSGGQVTGGWWETLPNRSENFELSFELQGISTIYDPRGGGSTGYSNNAALVIRDFLVDPVHGIGIPTAKIDETSFGAAADISDEVVNGAARYTINIAFTSQGNSDDWLTQLLACCNAQIYMKNGKYAIWMDAAVGTTTLALDTATNCRDIKYEPVSAYDIPSRVVVEYPNSAKNFAPDTTIIEDPLIATGEVELNEARYKLGGVSTLAQANRVATYLYNRAHVNLDVTLTASPAAAILSKGQKVTLTSSDGLAAQPFIVWEIEEDQPGEFNLFLRQYDSSIYSETAITGDTPPLTVLPDYTTASSIPPRVWKSTFAITQGTYGAIGTLAWSAPKALTKTLYGSSYWTASNYTTFTASQVNDGNEGTLGVQNTAATDMTLVFDAGSGVTKKFLALRVYGSSTQAPNNVIVGAVEYSDNGSSWTAVTSGVSTLGNIDYVGFGLGGARPAIYWEWDDSGAHRYWRIRKGSGAAYTLSWYEVQFLEGDGNKYRYLSRIEVWNHTPAYATPQLIATLPMSATGMDVSSYLVGSPASGTDATNYIGLFNVRTVSRWGLVNTDGPYHRDTQGFVDASASMATVTLQSQDTNTAQTGNALVTGNVRGSTLRTTSKIEIVEGTLPAVSAAGEARLAMDSSDHTVKLSTNGGAYSTFGGGGTVTGSGTSTRVAFWSSGTAISSDSALYWDNSNKYFQVGVTTADAPLMVSQNATTTAPAPPGPRAIAHFIEDNGQQGRALIDTFGAATGTWWCRHAGGTMAVPQVTNNGYTIGGIFAQGRGSTGYTSGVNGNGSLRWVTTQTYGDSTQGTRAEIWVTPTNSSTSAAAAYFSGEGVSIFPNGAGVVPFAGQLRVDKSGSGTLGGDVWITNSGTNAVGSTARLSFGPDASTDSTPNAALENIITATSGSKSDLAFKFWDGSGYNEKVRFQGDTGWVGIGTSAPSGIFHVASNTTGQVARLQQASADTDGFNFNFIKGRGTVASPSAITSGDELGTINFNGYSGAGGFVTGAAIAAYSAGTIATTRVPAELRFYTGTDAAPTVLTERMRIDKAGTITGADQPRIVAWQGTGTSLTTVSNTNVLFDTNSSVTGENTASWYPMHSTSSNTDRFYAPVDGFYMVRFSVVLTGTPGELNLQVKTGGGVWVAQHSQNVGATSNNTWAEVVGMCQLTAGDYVYFFVYNYGGTLTTTTGRGNTMAQMVKLW